MNTKSKQTRRQGGAGARLLALLIGAQAVMPFLVYFLAQPLARVLSQPVERVFLLLLFLGTLAVISAGVVLLWRPYAKLEQLMLAWRRSRKLPGASAGHGSALETLFVEILQEQMQSVEREYKTEVLRQQAELMALQSQINPHFLYNTLDSIRGLAIHHQVPEIADMTEALSKLFRRMIAKESMLITLAEELQSVDNYMLIQKFRFHNRFGYQLRIEDESLLSLMVPNLIIQPIVENAIVHGLEKREGSGEVQIYAYATQNRLMISVEDNGVGVPPDKLDAINAMLRDELPVERSEKGSGMGIALPNINQRIKLRFGASYGVNIMSTQGVGATVEIVLPRIEADQERSHG